MIDRTHIEQALDSLGLEGTTLCVHGSLKSFGNLAGGAGTLIAALLEKGRTIMMPTFYYNSIVRPPEGVHLLQNGENEEDLPQPDDSGRIPYESTNRSHIARSMGIIPRTLLANEDAVRGYHPVNSFTAAGPKANSLMAVQSPLDVYAPYRLLEEENNAWIILMGVGLNKATPIHYGEALAGRNLFHVWAQISGGQVVETRCGSCSDGFPRLDPFVADIEQRIQVGDSFWRVYRFKEFVHRIAEVVRANPEITHCKDNSCTRCRDIIAGGPVETLTPGT